MTKGPPGSTLSIGSILNKTVTVTVINMSAKEGVDIFKNTSAAPQNGEFFKFAEIGDGIQGTYVDRREGKDGYMNDQIIYVLKDKEGKLWNAAFRTTSVVVHERMKNAKLGYIVGFKYDSDGVVKRGPNAGAKFRIVNAYFDGKMVDKEWVKDHPGAEVSVSSPSAVEEGAEPVRVGFPDNIEAREISEESIKTIRDLAHSKGLTELEPFTDEENEIVDEAIREYVGMPLTEENLPKIIIKLTQYKG